MIPVSSRELLTSSILIKTSPLLFRYLAAEWALKTLEEQQFMVSQFSDFNDPFDGAISWSGKLPTIDDAREAVRRMSDDPDLTFRIQAETGVRLSPFKARENLRKTEMKTARTLLENFPQNCVEEIDGLRAKLNQDLRVLCFSGSTPDPHDEALLWAHYGGEHAGIRIGLEITTQPDWCESLRPVVYKNERVTIELGFDRSANATQISKALWESLFRKSMSWRYEAEYRLIVHPELCAKIGGLNYFRVDPKWVKFVDLGAKFQDPAFSERLEKLKSKYSGAKFRRATITPLDYTLEYRDG